MDHSKQSVRYNSPAIQEAVESVRPQVEGFISNLDAMSDDIKRVEAFLSTSRVRLPIKVLVSESGIDSADGSQIGENFSGAIYKEVECIAWAEDEKTSRWRIMYRRDREEGFFCTA